MPTFGGDADGSDGDVSGPIVAFAAGSRGTAAGLAEAVEGPVCAFEGT